MKFRIHRGAHEVGGNCIEVKADGKSILLDLGLPLDAPGISDSLLPNISGLIDGGKLKKLLAETMLDNVALKDVVSRKW